MDSGPPRPSLLGVLLLAVKLSALVVQNRVYVYNFLLIKIFLFNHWLSELSREAQGPSGLQDHPRPRLAGCPMGRALRAGLTLIEFPVWLLLQGPRLAWAVLQGCARALHLGPLQSGALDAGGLSLATWTHTLLSCVHSLLLATVVLALLGWRLLQKARDCSLGRLSYKALLENCAAMELVALLKRLYRWVESSMALTSWHLAYLVTWTTCLASHLLQAAFEHAAQLAQAQEAELQDSGPLFESLGPESAPTAGERAFGTPGPDQLHRPADGRSPLGRNSEPKLPPCLLTPPDQAERAGTRTVAISGGGYCTFSRDTCPGRALPAPPLFLPQGRPSFPSPLPCPHVPSDLHPDVSSPLGSYGLLRSRPLPRWAGGWTQAPARARSPDSANVE
ncbi:transmembrane protein 270 [Sorex fumeus]|uniref:transmembrane protein 270 n=1 Tax=Sorex fumeus TaxID=62283 RepID=UPI0024AE0809|nr:transmembrane protein 270 [Sorex fumeus]